jgi:hypothetical protein
MDPFRGYYISTIIPQLKKIEDERKLLAKKIATVVVITSIVIGTSVILLIILTGNSRLANILFAIPIPTTFFLKDLINSYSNKYKKTIIRDLFLSYFDNYVIDTEKKVKDIMTVKLGLLSLNSKINIYQQDFITVTYKGNDISIQEILLKKGSQVYFKGILCSMDMKNCTNQTIIFFNQDILSAKYLSSKGFKMTNLNNVNVYYQESFDLETFKPFVDFTSQNAVSLSIQDGKLYYLFPAEMMNEKLDLFDPILITKFNSNETYRYIRNEYYRIGKLSRLLLKLEEINISNLVNQN